MAQPLWQSILCSNPNQDTLWELFHENSKNRRYQSGISEQTIIERVNRLHESLPFEGYPVFHLPTVLPKLNFPLGEAITTRSSTLSMTASPLTFEALATLLNYAYGVTRDNSGAHFPRPFRAVPSAGALYPLEIFFHSNCVEDLPCGLYHYNPSRNQLRLLQQDIKSEILTEAFIQSHVSSNASLLVFITALFERSVFKYGERGYRYTLMEAGHVAQNVYLVSTALQLACLSIGGFLDDRIDNFLGFDGIRQSTIYVMAVGEKDSKTSGKGIFT